MATQVLIIHGQLPFAIKLKQTLERSGPFEVHPFTSVEAAVDYLKEHVQDVVLVDFAMPDFQGVQILAHVREVQPDIAVIVTPHLDDDQVAALDVLGSIDSGFSARDLTKLINDYFTQRQRPSYEPPATTALLSRLSTGGGQHGTLPGNLPEYSSLDNVLSSAGGSSVFEPPAVEGDTPPSADLVWADEPPKPESSFEEVLNSLPPDAPEQAAPRNPFTDLVNSMRGDETHQPLPSRQQQFVEFILTGGMDSLLDEIEQVEVQEGDTPQTPTKTVFERLAQEEPPPPAFEESGTVSDLVTGVQDKSFRNVLSILRGEEVSDESGEQEVPPPSAADFQVEPRPKPETPRKPEETYEFDDEPTPAKVILQRTLEQTVSGGNFSLEELLANIDAQLPLHRPKVQPLPSWLLEQQRRSQDDAFLVREPDFLPEELPEEPTPSEDLYPDQTTQPARGQQIEANPEALETEWLEHPPRAADDTLNFPDTLPEEIPAEATIPHEFEFPEELLAPPEEEAVEETPTLEEAFSEETPLPKEAFVEESPVSEETPAHAQMPVLEEESEFLLDETPVPQESSGVWYDLPDQDFNTQFELMAAFEVHNQSGVASGALYTEVPVTPQAEAQPAASESIPAPAESMQDPYLAQLALSLTEVSLELTAEATLLARNQQIVAYAGQMPAEEIEELRGAIADDWDAAPGEARIRFMTAKGSGKDYMLYSRRTEDDFTLSLIFAGTTPLRDIRRQGQRLVDALLSVPEAPPATLPEVPPPRIEPVEAGARTPYACVWVLRDPQAHLDPAVSQALIAGLNVQMREKQWDIQALQVHEDYVYLLADVPGEEPAYQIVRDLKRRAAEIAHAQNPAYIAEGLWAESYLVVTPGRELDTEEIQQYINFERME